MNKDNDDENGSTKESDKEEEDVEQNNNIMTINDPDDAIVDYEQDETTEIEDNPNGQRTVIFRKKKHQENKK